MIVKYRKAIQHAHSGPRWANLLQSDLRNMSGSLSSILCYTHKKKRRPIFDLVTRNTTLIIRSHQGNTQSFWKADAKASESEARGGVRRALRYNGTKNSATFFACRSAWTELTSTSPTARMFDSELTTHQLPIERAHHCRLTKWERGSLRVEIQTKDRSGNQTCDL